MKKHKYIAILIPLLGLAACVPSKEEDELRTPELFNKVSAEYFIYKNYEESTDWWGVSTTTEDLAEKAIHIDYSGKIHHELYSIQSYEEKDSITKDDKYFIYQKTPVQSSSEQSMTVYDNGYIEIKSAHGFYGSHNSFYFYIDPELVKSIHDSVDEQIRAYESNN